MPSRTAGMNIGYELPAAVRSVRDSWSATAAKAASICALFAVAETQLLVFVKDPMNFQQPTHHTAMKALLAFSYSGLVLGVSGAVSSLVLIDVFGEMGVRASRTQTIDTITSGTVIADDAKVLEMFGARRSLRWWALHWTLTMLAMTFSILTQILLYIWLQESRSIQITATIVVAFSAAPLLYFIPRCI
ncbi:hypothetical protein BDW22DRAFT_338892 [Trametopsis cervina]|nr:hypothetical protein BDW22DRAFT_338892 [Trametopsis cervina]